MVPTGVFVYRNYPGKSGERLRSGEKEDMRKILLMSDSHGNPENMMQAVAKEAPDMVLFMGDGWRDLQQLKRRYPKLEMHSVVGNCDWTEGPSELVLEVEGHRILMCHGHRYSVKSSLLSLQLAAHQAEADVVLFGHTHMLFYDWYDGLVIVNPGSIGDPRPGASATYALLLIDGEEVKVKTGYLN